MEPPKPTTPLSSEELMRDAEKANIATDEITKQGGDTHLPASESGWLGGENEQRPAPDRSLTNLPPG